MLTPLNDRVIIKRSEVEEMSKGGIVLTPSDQEKPSTGIVISSSNAEVEAGDTVMFSKYAGNEMQLNDETVLIVKFEELIAKVG